MVTEEFSFPTISTNIAQLTATPSLWRISSQVKSNFEEFDGSGRTKIFRQCFCGVGEIKRHDLIEEESMDLLWESFNDDDETEEFEGKSSLESFCGTDFDCGEENSTEDGAGICSNMQALKASKTNSGLPFAKKHRMVLVLKVMKKLLLLHSMARHKKRNF